MSENQSSESLGVSEPTESPDTQRPQPNRARGVFLYATVAAVVAAWGLLKLQQRDLGAFESPLVEKCRQESRTPDVDIATA